MDKQITSDCNSRGSGELKKNEELSKSNLFIALDKQNYVKLKGNGHTSKGEHPKFKDCLHLQKGTILTKQEFSFLVHESFLKGGYS